MAGEVRVRFAPSPTGHPHIGNIRTALFNWLFARHHGGKFIVRVEDTDQARLVPGAVEAILDGLRWLGIDWDEGPEVDGPYGPYFQSQRLKIYHQYAQQLVDQNNAYHCYCSKERLEQLRHGQRENHTPPKYDCNCRYLSHEEKSQLQSTQDSDVIRFAMPNTGFTRVHDLIRGDVEWKNRLLDDFIILKSDGFPTYHLAVVADDHLMKISHVMRAEEWLPSTPRHLQIYQALGFDPPKFAHLPMIMGPDRAKLSKRHGATAIGEYKEEGYLPEALRNFMVLLGWSLDDKTEVMPVQTIIENFSLERVSKSAAIFDQEKLLWMNGMYIRDLPPDDLAGRVLPFVEEGLRREYPDALPVDQEYVRRIAPLVQERIKRLDEMADMSKYKFFFRTNEGYDPEILVQKGMDREGTVTALKAALADLGHANGFDHESLEALFGATCERLGLSRRQFFGALRVASTGQTVSPPLFETMEVLGRDRIVSRMKLAVEKLAAAS